MFQGEGYGDLGHQYMFNTTREKELMRLISPGDSEEVYVLIPKQAIVTSVSLSAHSISYDGTVDAAVRAMDRVFEALGPVVATLERAQAVDRAPEPLLAPGVRELADIR